MWIDTESPMTAEECGDGRPERLCGDCWGCTFYDEEDENNEDFDGDMYCAFKDIMIGKGYSACDSFERRPE